MAARKGWRFPFLSSQGSTFNADFQVEFDSSQVGEKLYNYGRPVFATQMPGASVFRKDADGAVYLTYSTFAVCPAPRFRCSASRVSVLRHVSAAARPMSLSCTHPFSFLLCPAVPPMV